jgi:hypothetical protein
MLVYLLVRCLHLNLLSLPHKFCLNHLLVNNNLVSSSAHVIFRQALTGL